MLRSVLLGLLAISTGSLAASCISNPKDYGTRLDAIINGSPYSPSTDCVDPKLMISIQSAAPGSFPETISKYKSYWAWVSGSANMEKYFEMASRHVNDRAGLAEEMLLYVGVPGPVDTSVQHTTVVFERSRMETFMTPLSPTWDNLFNYLADFQMCPMFWRRRLGACTEEKLPFSPEVKAALTTSDVEAVTGCNGPLEISGQCGVQCLPDFCQTQGELIEARKQGTRACVEAFAATDGINNAAKSRAFFEVCIGCNELFTGNGFGHNGVSQTGPEFLVRGDVPLNDFGAERYILYSP